MRLRLSNGLALGYRTAGAGRVVTLLHPVGTNAEFWNSTVAELSKNYRCIAIDMRGCGDSDTPGQPFSLDDIADDVIELLRRQGIQGSVVVGCSMGGMVAQGMLLKAPELFTGMVLSGTINTQTPERRKVPEGRGAEALNGMPPVVDATLKRWFAPNFLAANGPEVQRTRDLLLSIDPVVFAWSWQAIAGLAYGERIRDIEVPALLIRGSEDAAGATMPEMAEMMPRGRFVSMPGAGHMAPLEDPCGYAGLIHDFIRGEIGA